MTTTRCWVENTAKRSNLCHGERMKVPLLLQGRKVYIDRLESFLPKL